MTQIGVTKKAYFSEGKPLTCEDGIGDYVAESSGNLTPWGYEKGIENFHNPYRSHEFDWGIGEIVTALLEAGLTLEVLKEYPYSNGCKRVRIHYNWICVSLSSR